jgi:acetoacetyl-[acyl-carrier protein] synthase
MSSLPVIVGFGGFNAAGRASGHQAYRRMILESLPDAERRETLAGLAVVMGLVLLGVTSLYLDIVNPIEL